MYRPNKVFKMYNFFDSLIRYTAMLRRHAFSFVSAFCCVPKTNHNKYKTQGPAHRYDTDSFAKFLLRSYNVSTGIHVLGYHRNPYNRLALHYSAT